MKFFLILILILSLTGCGTIKGLVEGMKSDYQKLKEIDKWFQEHYW